MMLALRPYVLVLALLGPAELHADTTPIVSAESGRGLPPFSGR
jgi:hypothetical protein